MARTHSTPGILPTPAIVRAERRLLEEDRGYATPCRIWPGARNGRRGYGVISVGSLIDNTKRSRLVHRLMYEHYVGPVPDGLVLDHLCRQTDCCEVSHLEPVTQSENMLRAPVRGRPGRDDDILLIF